MSTSSALQLLGYAASILIAISLMMRSIVRLRMINLTGAALFSIYGFLIGAYPVGILNFLTASINIVQLIRLRRRKEMFKLLEVRGAESDYLQHFLSCQGNDIRRFIPSFRFDPDKDSLALFVLRDLVPAGLLLGEVRDGVLRVDIDYAIPQYRDLKIGRFLFEDQISYFRKLGVTEIVSPAGVGEHPRYLERMGFEPVGDGEHYRLMVA
ncbi:MAG: YgjV family protein [Thermoanaerobaculia bacterium]